MRMTLRRDPFALMNQFFNDDGMFDLVEYDDIQVDVYEEKNELFVKVKAGDFDEKSIDVSVQDNAVVISGRKEVKKEEEDKERKYYRKEISTRSFNRSIPLPVKVDANKAEATFKNGVLTLKLPKSVEALPQKVEIKAE